MLNKGGQEWGELRPKLNVRRQGQRGGLNFRIYWWTLNMNEPILFSFWLLYMILLFFVPILSLLLHSYFICLHVKQNT